MQIRQQRVVLNGVTTYVEAFGSGPPLVIVHGWAASRVLWKSHQRPLSRDFRVVSYDLRGHGDAGKPEDVPYTIPQFADDLRSLLDLLGLERAHLLGHSMGGFVAQEFAIQHPNRVDKLVLSGTTMGQGSLDTPEAHDMIDMLRSGGFADFIEFGADLWFHTAVPQDVIELSRTVAKRCPDYVALAAMEGLLRWTSRGRLDEITAPTLVIAGAEDSTQPSDTVRELADALPHATLHLLENAGHDCYLEAPEAYRRAIRDFLTSAA